MLQEVYNFNGQEDGAKLLILGAIHGNEVCGTNACRKIQEQIESGEIKLKQGSLTLIPVCNQKAYENNERYYEENLNRVIKKHDNPSSYEAKLGSVIADYITSSDYLLDLHSMHTNGVPFVFQDYNEEKIQNLALAQNLEYIFMGWPQIYADVNNEDNTTESFAYKANTVAVTVECGEHGTKGSDEIAYNCILNTLRHLGMIDVCDSSNARQCETKVVEMQKVIYKKSDGEILSERTHLDYLQAGEVVARYSDGKEIYATEDCYIIMPNKNANIGDEWFYFGRLK